MACCLLILILRKLTNYGVDPNALRFFASYLCNRSQTCSVNGALSSTSKLNCGVPQISILEPLFFLIYTLINDLPNCLDISCGKFFADDINITVPPGTDPGCTFAELEQATTYLAASLNSSHQRFLAENCSELNIQLDNQQLARLSMPSH